MRIKDVYIKNFRGYGINPQTEAGYFEFKEMSDNRIVIFSGFNGFGKTSFFDSIEWCLSGEIKRLRDRQIIQMKSNLKKSQQLKFVEALSTDLVDVIIRFDNDKSIRRTTSSNSLFATDYNTTIFNESNEEISEADILKLFDSNSDIKINTLSNINFLGQDNITKFIHGLKATERTTEFMKFMGQGKISDIVEESTPQKFNVLDNKIKKIKNSISENNSIKEQIDKNFETENWNSTDEYFSGLTQLLNNFYELLKGLTYDEITKLFTFQEIKELSDKEKLDSLKSIVLQKTKLINLKSNIINQRKIIRNINFIQSLVINNDKMSDLEMLKNIDFNQYTQDLTASNTQKNNHLKTNSQISDMKRRIDSVRKIIEDFEISKNILTEVDVRQIKKMYHISEWVTKMCKKHANSNDFVKEYIPKESLDFHLEKSKAFINNKAIEEKELAKLNMEITTTTDLTNEYNEVLSSVRQLIINQEEISECPICLSSNFEHLFGNSNVDTENDMDVKKLLLASMNHIEAKGNCYISEKITIREKITSKISELTDEYNKSIFNVIKRNLEDIISTSINELDLIDKSINKYEKCNATSVTYYNGLAMKLSATIINYERVVQKLFAIENVDEINSSRVNREIENLSDVFINQQKYYLEHFDDKGEYKIQNVKDKKIDFENQVEKEFQKIELLKVNEYITELLKVNTTMDNLQEFILTEEFVDLIKKEKETQKKINSDTNSLASLVLDKETVVEINRNALKLQDELIKQHIEENPLIQWIYETINPHPFFRKIHVSTENSGLNIKDSKGSEVFLDHMFSSAQSNVLAISIFLGIALTQKISPLKQIFMDDPVQSMDDVNILAYIDLIRAIDEAKHCSNDLIISTHDIEFTKLLKIKLRNRSFKIYSFEGYNKYGPEISVY